MTTTTQSLSAEAIREKILNSTGQFVKVKWKSNPTPAAPFKKTGVILEKVTEGVVRAGINYANLSSVKSAIAAGERPAEIAPLPFGTWKIFPYIIQHTNKDGVYCEYLRLYPSQGSNHFPSSLFYVNGEVVNKEKFAEYLTPSESKKLLHPQVEDVPECFTIKMDNLMGIPEDVCD